MKVIGYTRVSTREQADDGYSLDVQRKAIETEAERRGWELVEVIEDDGYTGRDDRRPGLQRALQMLKRKRARAIIVVRMDRLARSLTHLGRFIDLSRSQKWAMVALDMDFDTTNANGRMIARILASVAEWESEVNGERVRLGMAEARAEGRQFGFQRQVEPSTVDRITNARRRGQSFGAIARRLDNDQTPTPGGGARWYPSTVARIYRTETETKERKTA